MLAAQEIGQAGLEALAGQRAEALRNAFMADGTFDESRLAVLPPTAVESEDGEWVSLELGVAAE